MTRQYLRRCELMVADANGNGLNLSDFKIEFNTFAADVIGGLPPLAYVRVYNLKTETMSKIKKEFTKLFLQAGYQGGQSGQIFSGTIIQATSGAIDAKDRFIDLVASDLEQMYSFGTMSKTLSAGSSKRDQVEAAIVGSEKYGASQGEIPDSFGTGGTLRAAR